VTLDAPEGVVRSVRFSAGRHRLVTEDGVEPMFMRGDEVVRWLASRGIGGARRRGEIVAPAAKLRLSFAWAYGGAALDGGVDAVELVEGIEVER
jgi:hypothetical protein